MCNQLICPAAVVLPQSSLFTKLKTYTLILPSLVGHHHWCKLHHTGEHTTGCYRRVYDENNYWQGYLVCCSSGITVVEHTEEQAPKDGSGPRLPVLLCCSFVLGSITIGGYFLSLSGRRLANAALCLVFFVNHMA